MGVPRLFPYLTGSFKKAVTYFQEGEYSTKVDYLYLDANGLLHGAAQRVFHYGSGKGIIDRYSHLTVEEKRKKVYQLFFQNIVQVSRVVIPQKELYIAIDGAAPSAKGHQQRQRRYISGRMRFEKHEKTGEWPFDSSSITPGTIFMLELTQYINYAIRNEMNSYGDWKHLRVLFSPPTVGAEGEHKCLDYMRSLSKEERTNATHCLFGPDGDLIMLTLSVHIPKIFLFREDQYNPGYMHIIDMGMVRQGLPRNLGQQQAVAAHQRSLNDTSDDFIVIGFFVGNDFLPKLQMFHLLEEGLRFMTNAYRTTSDNGQRDYLTTGGRFSIPGFRKFIAYLAQYEQEFLISQFTRPRIQPPGPEYVNETLGRHIMKERGGKYALNFQDYRKDYYQKAKEDDLEGLCHDYLRTLIWVFDYYAHGLPDWHWAYEHHYPPLMSDFNDYLQLLTAEQEVKIAQFELHEPSLPFVQLLSVLPPTSAGLLPGPYRRLMLDPKSPLVRKGYYPSVMDFDIDYEGKIKEHEGIALLPFVQYADIHRAYEKMTACCIKDITRYIRNTRGKVAAFYYDPNYRARFTSKMGDISFLQIRREELEPCPTIVDVKPSDDLNEQMEMAAFRGNFDRVKELADQGATHFGEAAYYAAQFGKDMTMYEWLIRNLDEDEIDTLVQRFLMTNMNGFVVSMIAAEKVAKEDVASYAALYGNIEMVETVLLSYQVRNFQDMIIEATGQNHLDIVRLVLEAAKNAGKVADIDIGAIKRLTTYEDYLYKPKAISEYPEVIDILEEWENSFSMEERTKVDLQRLCKGKYQNIGIPAIELYQNVRDYIRLPSGEPGFFGYPLHPDLSFLKDSDTLDPKGEEILFTCRNRRIHITFRAVFATNPGKEVSGYEVKLWSKGEEERFYPIAVVTSKKAEEMINQVNRDGFVRASPLPRSEEDDPLNPNHTALESVVIGDIGMVRKMLERWDADNYQAIAVQAASQNRTDILELALQAGRQAGKPVDLDAIKEVDPS